MELSIATSEIASAAETEALSEDHTEHSRKRWAALGKALRKLEIQIAKREAADKDFKFSRRVKFPSRTPKGLTKGSS